MPKLSVRAADETTEIFVIAADFALRGRGARRLDQDLLAGIYKVRAVSGRSECQSALNNDPPSASKFDPPWS